MAMAISIGTAVTSALPLPRRPIPPPAVSTGLVYTALLWIHDKSTVIVWTMFGVVAWMIFSQVAEMATRGLSSGWVLAVLIIALVIMCAFSHALKSIVRCVLDSCWPQQFEAVEFEELARTFQEKKAVPSPPPPQAMPLATPEPLQISDIELQLPVYGSATATNKKPKHAKGKTKPLPPAVKPGHVSV